MDFTANKAIGPKSSQQSHWTSALDFLLHVINALVNFLNTVMFKLWCGDNFVTTLVPRLVEH